MDLEILSNSKMNANLIGLHMETEVHQLKIRAGPIWRSSLTESKELTSNSPWTPCGLFTPNF